MPLFCPGLTETMRQTNHAKSICKAQCNICCKYIAHIQTSVLKAATSVQGLNPMLIPHITSEGKCMMLLNLQAHALQIATSFRTACRATRPTTPVMAQVDCDSQCEVHSSFEHFVLQNS